MDATHFYSNGDSTAVKASAPINLKERYGNQYRVSFEESYYAQYGAQARIDDCWLQTIVGRLGHIFPFGGNLLAAGTAARGPLARRLATLPFCQVWQDGDDGVTVVFPAQHLVTIAKLLRIPRRRQLTDAQLKSLAEHGAAYRFTRPNANPSDRSGEVAS